MPHEDKTLYHIENHSSPNCALQLGEVWEGVKCISADGSQHLEQQEYDAERTRDLESQKYRVLRFWNHEVMKDVEGVLLVILQALGKGGEQ